MAKKFIIKKLRELMEHQVNIFKYMLERGKKGSALFVEMRLGKTLPCIRYHQRLQLRKPILVICPNSVVSTWIRELHLEYINDVFALRGSKNKRLKLMREAFNYDNETSTGLNIRNNRWVIVNFESVITLNTSSLEWGAIIIDESYRIANPKSSITKYLLGKKIKYRGETHQGFKMLPDYRTILCGNPAPENELNYACQFLVFQKQFLGFLNYWDARFNLFNKDETGFNYIPKPGVKERIYLSKHRNAFVLTRQEAGIGSKKIHSIREIEMTPSQRSSYNNMLHYWSADGVETSFALTQTLYLSRIAGGMKLTKDVDPDHCEWHSLNKFNEIIYLLNSELKNQSIIVWFRFRAEQHKMAEILSQNNISHCIINGDVPATQREISRLQFQNGEYQVSLMIIETGKVGQDWSKADTEIYFSNEYSCDARTQSEDRIVHPLKTTPLLVMDLVASNSIDGDVLSLLQKKVNDSKFFMNKLYLRIHQASQERRRVA